MRTVVALNEIPAWVVSVGASNAPTIVAPHERKKHVGPIYTRKNPQRVAAMPDRNGNLLVHCRNRWLLICPIRSA